MAQTMTKAEIGSRVLYTQEGSKYPAVVFGLGVDNKVDLTVFGIDGQASSIRRDVNPHAEGQTQTECWEPQTIAG